ncbi:hypothetical protein AGMMS49928_13030 [Spirochaetia bacterium]|nr:hypothetical protein AGMMS49928_13030 [Spirochaetia bacterium]
MLLNTDEYIKIINESVWENKFIENLSRDIKRDYPDSTGYSVRNLKYMAKFAQIYLDEILIVQRGVAQLPWRRKCLKSQ